MILRQLQKLLCLSELPLSFGLISGVTKMVIADLAFIFGLNEIAMKFCGDVPCMSYVLPKSGNNSTMFGKS